MGLARQYKQLVPAEEQIVYDGESLDEFGSLWRTWYNVLEEMHNVSRRHEQLAFTIEMQVHKPLSDCSKDLDVQYKKLVAEGMRQEKYLADAYATLQKMKTTHLTREKDLRDHALAAKTARADFQTKERDLSKQISKKRMATERATSALDDVCAQERQCAKIQAMYYQHHLPSVLSVRPAACCACSCSSWSGCTCAYASVSVDWIHSPGAPRALCCLMRTRTCRVLRRWRSTGACR